MDSSHISNASAQGTERLPLIGKRTLITYAVLAILWVALTWIFCRWLAEVRVAEYVAREHGRMQQEVTSISDNFGRVLNRLQGVPAVLAAGRDVTDALDSFGPDASRSVLPVAERKHAWMQRADLQSLNRHLATIVREMDADIVWVMNASGDCVASSNFDQQSSFIGVNYADRDYFKSAQAGNRGRQYAMGRMTNIPGLYFSAPVTSGGRFLGTVTLKIDLPRLVPWINHPHAFVADDNGVVILASNREREMRALPGASVHEMSEAQRMAHYKRIQFAPLRMEADRHLKYAGLVRVAGSVHPYFATFSEREQDGISIHILAPAEGMESLRRDAFAIFLALSFAGVMLFVLLLGMHAYLLRARQHRLSIEQTNASLEMLNQHLDQVAKVDSLTGCANRRHFQSCLEAELARAGRYNHECGLLMIDIDLFKRINDDYGHAAGDEALRHFVRIVGQQLRNQDVLGRLGGEEFAVLLPETDLENALAAAERIRGIVETTPARFGEVVISFTASFGVACLTASEPAESADSLMRRADAALYRAKSEGRNRICSAEMPPETAKSGHD